MAAGGAGALRRDERHRPPSVRGDKHDDADVLLRLQQQRHSGVHHLADAGGSDLGCRDQRRAQPIEVQFREPIGTQTYHRFQLPASAFSTCVIYAAVGIALLALVWWLYKKRPSETAGDAMSFRWLRPIARWSIGLCGGLGLGLFLRYTAFIDGGFACLLICQLVMGVICFFAAQMLLQRSSASSTSRWWLETAAMVLVLAAVTLCVKLDITGYQHRVPDAEDVTSVRFSASYADFTTDDPAAVESVISLHRAILEQYDETGERLEKPNLSGHGGRPDHPLCACGLPAAERHESVS